MWFKNRTLDNTITFSASTTQSLQLPRDRWIRQIMLRTRFTHTYGTSIVAGTHNFHKIHTQIRVVASGNDQLKAVEGYRLWTMNKYLHGCATMYDEPINSDSGTTKDVYFLLHFALNPANPFDYSALLPAHLLSSLDLYVTFGSVTTYLGGAGTSTTGVTYVTVTEAYIDRQEEDMLFGQNKEKLFKMYETEQVYAISAACADYSQYIDVPVGSRIKKLGIFTETSSAYSDAVIAKYRVRQMSPIDMELFHSEWLSSKQEDKLYYQLQEGKWTTVVGQDCTETGFTMYDPEFKSGFLDTRGMKLGDLKFQMNTTPATGNIYLYFIQFV